MRIAICDDETSCCSTIQTAIEKWLEATSTYDIQVHVFQSSEDLLHAYERIVYDVVFLDIQIPNEISGYELAKQIRSINETTQIIFTTNFSEFAIQGYNVNALRYLLKPVSQDQINECLDIAYNQWQLADGSALLAVAKDCQQVILHRDILYLESKGHHILIHSRTADEPIQIRSGLDHIYGQLPHELFVRCHKGYIVNISCVRKLTYSTVTLFNGKSIPVGIRHKNSIYQAFEAYHQGR